MSAGPGLLTGLDVVDLVSISPDSLAYDDHSGPTFHPQNENSNGNIAFYEVTSAGDTIEFNLSRYTGSYDRPAFTVNTIFGTTEYDIYDREQERIAISEKSGYHSNLWVIDMDNTSSKFRLENFSDTQAGFYAYIEIYNEII